MKILKAIATFAVLAAPFAASADPIVSDGSFEDETSGWTLNGNGQINCGVNFGAGAQDGNCYAAFTSNRNGGSVEQMIDLSVGSYEISFWLAQRGGGRANTNVRLRIDGNDILSQNIALNTATGVWTNFVFNFHVASAANNISLLFGEIGTSRSRGPILDNVSIAAVPEPGTLALLGLGLAGLGFAKRKKA